MKSKEVIHITKDFNFAATNINEMAEWIMDNHPEDYALVCECGSVGFALRRDKKMECIKCSKVTKYSWDN